MVITSKKMTCQKASPKLTVYHDMKWFDKTALKSDLALKLATTDPKSYLNFENPFMNILDKHAPAKQKTLGANHKPYVSKGMRQAIMKRSELDSKYRKQHT